MSDPAAREIGNADALIATRQNVSPRRLVEPGPDSAQRARIYQAAAAAPDHGLLVPWRFVEVPRHRRVDLAEVFARALIERDPGATLEQIEAAREKAHRAPFLTLAVARLGACEPDIPVFERVVSAGCAIQNMLLAAHGMGLGSGLTSGKAMASQHMRSLFGLVEGEEEAICFVNIGAVSRHKAPRLRPESREFVSSL